MLEEQVKEFVALVKNDDLKEYAGDAFWNFVAAIISKDPVAGALTIKDVKQLIIHMPTAIFWDKMRRFLMGTFRDYSEQVKMASYFNNDEKRYAEFVKKQIYLIDELDDEKKIDCFAMLTRCMLIEEMDISLYFKLAQFIKQCTFYELEYMRETSVSKKQKNSAMVSSLYQYGLLNQESDDKEVYYVFSGFGKALKGNCLNYGDEMHNETFLTYNSIEPLNILEPALSDIDMHKFFD